METIEIIKKLLHDSIDIDPDIINDGSTMEALGLDSIDIAELVCNLEDELNIDFGQPIGLETIGDVVKHVDSLR